MSIGKGYVHVYTGEGKGKTTAALGLTLRALGAGCRVLFAQFMKQGEFSEIKALRRFGDQVSIRQFGSGRFVRGKPARQDVESASREFEEIKKALREGKFDLIVMDEINIAIYFKILPLSDVLELIADKPEGTELVLTGRWAEPRLIDEADVVTEMVKVKHYYEKGVKARTGIEK